MESSNVIEFSFLSVIGSTIKFIKKNRKRFLFVNLLSLSLAISVYIMTPSYYESHMSLYSETFNDVKIIDQLDEVKFLVTNQDFKQLSLILGIDIETCKTIKKFYTEIEPQDEKENIKTRGVLVFVTTTNQSNYNVIRTGVVNYLENNTFIKERKTLRNLAFLKNLEQVKNEISFLNNKREEIFKLLTLTSGKNLVFTDITLLSARIIELEERKDRLNEQIKFYQDILVTKDFQFSNKKAGPRFLYYLITGFILGSILSAILSSIPKIILFVKES